MSTQQDIYRAGSKSCPPMLNKENYVSWSSRLLRYAKSRPNGKLIHNSIINGPNVRRMILEPGDTNREVPVNETFHIQTDDELTEKELKQIEADDQAIQTILLSLPEDIYEEKKAKLFNEWERFTSNEEESIESYYHRNGNQIGNGNLVAARAEGNAVRLNGNHIRCYNCRGKEEVGIQLQAEEFDLMAAAADLDEIEDINANCILMANLQQASTSGTQTDKAPVYDSDGSAEVHDYENCDDNEIFNMFTQEEQYTELLEPIPESHQFLKEAAKFVGDFKSLAKEADESLAKHKALELEIKRLLRVVIERLQAQLGDLKGKSQDTSCVSDTLNLLSQKHENENAELEFQSLQTQFPHHKNQALCKIKKVITPGMFRINPCKTSREEKHMPNNVSASARTKPITVSQPPIITKKYVNSDSNGLSSTGIDNTKTRRPQPRRNTKNDRVPFASTSSRSKNKELDVEEHHRNLLLSTNKKHISSAFKHDECLLKYVNDMNSHGRKQMENVSIKENQKKRKPKVNKPKKVEFIERLATPKPSKPRSFLRWSPTGRFFDLTGKIITSREFESQSECSKVDNACSSNHMEPSNKRFPNATFSLAGQLCDSDLEVAFRRNACFVRNFEGVNLLKGDHSTNLYTINLHEIVYASPICLMARASSTKSWLWHQRLSHLNFETINDLAKNDLVSGLPKFKYYKEHLCPSCEQGKSKRTSHPPKPVPNSRVVERRNRTLVEAARTMLIFSHAPLFLWAEAIATACFTQNRSIIHRHFNKTPYELINGRKPDISFLNVFGALCYPKNDREDIGKLGAKGDIGFFIAMAFEQHSLKPGLQSMTYGQISSGLDLTYAPSTITTQQLTEGDLDLLFEAMYDDFIGGQPSATTRTVLAAQEPQVRQASTTSTLIAETAPTPINSSSQATNFPCTLQDVDKINLNAIFDGNSFEDPFATSSTSATESSSSQNVDPSNMHTTMEPKNVKDAMTDPAWIESMQEELLQFKRLDVWMLVPAPDNISPLTLKWLFKNKYDEEQTVIRNKSRLVMRGYRQEEGINFEESFASNHFFKGTIDLTLFIRRFDNDILVVQVYVDDIIFGSTHPRPDIVHATCLCARYQAKTTEKHLNEVKRIFRYLWGTVNTGLWYTKDSGFELTGFSDVDYAGCKDTFKSTSGGAQFLALPADRFNYLVHRLGMRSLSPQELNRLAKSQFRRWCYNLILAESRFKTSCSFIKDTFEMKAQVHVSKSSAIFDVQALPQKEHY
uniref:Retrovirus-related Pol polyprotein from transposon TNT 1-94 n=1 Tax=Tanacetum cinerariifolium TaxID=118510 RepID=A0A6L2J7S7_TANCI|nr:retrovirus-related Pol polyprotein from transposon TNT 1-94 [Tanacetum cinerariifolium]